MTSFEKGLNVWFLAVAVCLALCFTPATVHGQSSSENYVLGPSVLDMSGGSVSSANYRLDFAAGEPSPSGLSTSSSYQLRAGFVANRIWPLTDVEPPKPPDIPVAFALLQNAPNPFRSSTVIRYHLPRDSYVKLRVFDVQGRLLRTLMDKREKAGYKALSWDGRLDDGRRVASGIYLYELKAEAFIACKKMIMAR